MSEALEKLQKIGAQKIYEQTHIPAEHVQAILHGSFEGFNKVQFIGFVSILEREYGVELQTLKLKGIAYFDDVDAEKKNSIVANEQQDTNKIVYVVVLLVLFAIVVFAYFFSAQEAEVKKELHQQTHEGVQKPKHKQEVADRNTTVQSQTQVKKVVEQNATVADANVTKQPLKEKKATPPSSFVLRTKKRLWVGYIDVQSNIKKQLTIKEYLEFDPTKEWLLLLGHGLVSFEIGDEKFEFHQTKGLRLHYKEGKLVPISIKEFKKLNRGSAW